MKSYYEKLVEEKGETVAKEYMRELRSKRKENKGGGFNDPKVVAKAVEKRKASVLSKKQLLQHQEVRKK